MGLPTPFYNRNGVCVYCEKCEAVLPELPTASIDLLATDPPYFKVKDEAWDRQWSKPAEFVTWMAGLCVEWQRLLKPNGSLYVFASPQMAWHVEGAIRGQFAILNRITWQKDVGWAKRQCKEEQRAYFPASETILFAEQFNSDNTALAGSGYDAKCDELRGFVFEPLRAYLDGERERAGVSFESVRQFVGCAVGSGLPSHWFTRSQWMLPTASNYAKLQAGFNRNCNGSGPQYLRREYEDLRRPFAVTADVPYTDVWDFPTVSRYAGKHPCEKPLALMEHIVRASSRENAVVLDCFGGSGTTAVACRNLGRKCIVVEQDERWCRRTVERLEGASMPLFTPPTTAETQQQATLF